MINPEAINLSTLPSVPIENSSKLPRIPGIYLAFDSLGVIQYIGRSANMKRRWYNHHRKYQLESMKGVRLAWIEVSELTLLPSIEEALITWFSPPLNRAFVESPPSQGIKVIRITDIDVPGLGEQIKRLREADGRSVDTIRKLVGVSRVYWYNIESEKVSGALSEKTLRKIEEVLGGSFGVSFDD
jgi:DNA-binding XRE family transcriptional regulator